MLEGVHPQIGWPPEARVQIWLGGFCHHLSGSLQAWVFREASELEAKSLFADLATRHLPRCLVLKVRLPHGGTGLRAARSSAVDLRRVASGRAGDQSPWRLKGR